MTNSAEPHHHPIRITPEDIDFMGHVNNAHYLKWVQEAVVAHWEKLAPPAAVAEHLWVALKHEITYRKPCVPERRRLCHSYCGKGAWRTRVL